MKDFKIDRRRFLQRSVAGAAFSMIPGLTFATLGNAQALPMGSNRVLLTIHLRGGNDGLNTVIPYDHSVYTTARPNLALPAAEVLPLEPGLGWHPALTNFRDLYWQGRLAVVNGVGYPQFDRSHFRASDIYWGADPVGMPTTGWLGRCLDDLALGSPLAGAFLGNSVPLLMLAESVSVPAFTSADNYAYIVPPIPGEGELQLAAFQSLAGQPPIGAAMFDGLLAQDVAALESSDLVQVAAQYQSSVVYPDNDFADRLKLAAQLIHADCGTGVIGIDFGGFDTHAAQANTHSELLETLGAGLSAFMADADASGFTDRVVVLVFSEFGRRVAENGSLGTDHGTSAPMFVLGDNVMGGMYQPYPDLNDLDQGDLKMTTDFRRVYATLIERWLGLDASAILGATWEPIGFL